MNPKEVSWWRKT